MRVLEKGFLISSFLDLFLKSKIFKKVKKKLDINSVLRLVFLPLWHRYLINETLSSNRKIYDYAQGGF